MSMTQLESAVWRATKDLVKNKKLRKKDIIEWTSGKAKPRPEEVLVKVEAVGMSWEVCILKEHDKRDEPKPNTSTNTSGAL